jgi:integrase
MAQLTDTKLKNLKPEIKAYKETDSNGLYVEIRVAGSKFFRYRYRHPITKKEQTFTIGEYPALTLKQAREMRDKAKELLAVGIDPNEDKKQKSINLLKEASQTKAQDDRMTFVELFKEWYAHNEKSWSYVYALKITQRAEKHLLPIMGQMAIEDIKPMDVINVLKLAEAGGRVDLTTRIRQYITRAYRYGIGFGYCEQNPASELTNDIFEKAVKENYAHTTDPKVLTQILRAIDSYIGDISIKKALELAPYIFLRSKELAGIRWDEIDLEKRLIEIPTERMKKKRPHVVPISSKVLEIIEYMHPLSGDCEYLFPSPRTKARPINEGSLNPGLHRLGFKDIQTFHGFRHTASTMLNEMDFMGDVIEKQLAHEESNKVRGAYNKAQYLSQRKVMMQAWSDYLDGLKNGADVIPLKRGAQSC